MPRSSRGWTNALGRRTERRRDRCRLGRPADRRHRTAQSAVSPSTGFPVTGSRSAAATTISSPETISEQMPWHRCLGQRRQGSLSHRRRQRLPDRRDLGCHDRNVDRRKHIPGDIHRRSLQPRCGAGELYRNECCGRYGYRQRDRRDRHRRLREHNHRRHSPVWAGNLISGSGRHGIYLYGSGTTGTQILGNAIGTDVKKTRSLANSVYGVYIDNGAHDNTIGGTTAAAGNLYRVEHSEGCSHQRRQLYRKQRDSWQCNLR
ncbi:MAG: hypothetical protein MZV70_66035 [Desulfobacterales bacterium]|nr:hypothetical protein [Desulfobacterales bacterium]